MTIPEILMTPTALLYLLARLALPVPWSQMTNEVGLDPEDAYTLLARNHGINESAAAEYPEAFMEAVRAANQ